MSGSNGVSTETLDQLKLIIRRDLNLGADEAIPDDMPLVGGEMDLDSLDVLMLVTSVEKQFKVKISNQNLGKEAFESVATLAAFIESSVSNATPRVSENDSKAASTQAGQSMQDILSRLPHGEPFRFVDKLISVEPGEAAEGVWEISGDEDFFAGHFPGNPLVPGALVSEALAQVSGLAFAQSDGGQPVSMEGRLAQINVRFRSPIAPPVAVKLKSRVSKKMGNLLVFDVIAEVSGQTVAEGSITLFDASSSTAG